MVVEVVVVVVVVVDVEELGGVVLGVSEMKPNRLQTSESSTNQQYLYIFNHFTVIANVVTLWKSRIFTLSNFFLLKKNS